MRTKKLSPAGVLTGVIITMIIGLLSASLFPVSARAVSASDQYEYDISSATTAARARYHLARYSYSSCLHTYAERQAAKMAREHKLSHQDLRLVLRGCPGLRTAGENVAAGYPTGTAAVNGWMNSAGHRANILSKSFRLFGYAAVLGSDRRWYAVQVFGG